MSQILHTFIIEEYSLSHRWQIWLPYRVVETDAILARQLLKTINSEIEIPKEFFDFSQSENGYFKIMGISICTITFGLTVYLSIPDHFKIY